MTSPTELPRTLLLILAVLGGIVVSGDLRAGSATWSTNPISGDWYTAENWNPNTVPNGPNDVATLGASSITTLTFPASSTTVLDSIILQSEADFYSVVVKESSLTFVGSGIPGLTGVFFDVASRSTLIFQGTSECRAGIYNKGIILFQDQSSRPTGGTEGDSGGVITFSDQSSAGGTFYTNGGVYFNDDSTAEQVSYLGVIGPGFADISGHNAPGLAIQKPYGDGNIYLGANNLTISSTDLFYPYCGSLKDGGAYGGTGGSLTKVGPPGSRAILDGSSHYTGGTTILGGVLLIQTEIFDTSSTPTGSGDVHVNAGGFGGTGHVLGNVIVGAGEGARASLILGGHRLFHDLNGTEITGGVHSIKQSLTVASDGLMEVTIGSQAGRYGEVSARGVTLTSGAQIEVSDRSGSKMATGTVLILIKNTADTPITGTFANLSDGGTLTVNVNTYQANYEGGDGNDLTLTVIE